MLQPLLEAQCGDGEDFLAALRPVRPVRRDEGGGGNRPGEGGIAKLQIKIDGDGLVCSGGEGIHPAALMGQPLHVDLADGQPRPQPRFRQQRAVFCNHVVARKHQVGGGFSLPRVGVHVGAQAPGGLARHQGAAVVRLARHLVAGGQVQHQGGPRLGQSSGGGGSGPEILADLNADGELPQGGTAEQPPGAQIHPPAAQPDRLVAGPAGGKPAPLIKFPVIGDVGLWNQPQQLPPEQNGGTVIELMILVPHRHTQRREHIQLPGLLQNPPQRPLRPVQQSGLQKQVAAGVPGDAQLRQGQHLYPLGRRLPHQGDDLPRVVIAVGHPDFGCARRHLHKAVPHGWPLLYLLPIGNTALTFGIIPQKCQKSNGDTPQTPPAFFRNLYPVH